LSAPGAAGMARAARDEDPDPNFRPHTTPTGRTVMIKNFEDIQKLSQTNLDTAMKVFGGWNKNWQQIASEVSDYTKRSFEDGTQTLEKLMSAKSIEQAVEIQTSYAKRAYDDYMHQMSKIGGLYAEIAKDAYKPVERAMQNAR
jgi:hypothetical protein